MSDEDEKHDKKKVTAATTDAPQEEFISPESQPSRPDPDAEQRASRDPEAPRR